VSLRAPDSPDRSCQEPVSTTRRHKQFANVVISYYYNRKGQYLEELKIAKIIYWKNYKAYVSLSIFKNL